MTRKTVLAALVSLALCGGCSAHVAKSSQYKCVKTVNGVTTTVAKSKCK